MALRVLANADDLLLLRCQTVGSFARKLTFSHQLYPLASFFKTHGSLRDFHFCLPHSKLTNESSRLQTVCPHCSFEVTVNTLCVEPLQLSFTLTKALVSPEPDSGWEPQVSGVTAVGFVHPPSTPTTSLCTVYFNHLVKYSSQVELYSRFLLGLRESKKVQLLCYWRVPLDHPRNHFEAHCCLCKETIKL